MHNLQNTTKAKDVVVERGLTETMGMWDNAPWYGPVFRSKPSSQREC